MPVYTHLEAGHMDNNGCTTGGDIYEALQNLTTLQKYVIYTPGTDTSKGWIARLMSGLWWHVFLKVLTPVFLLTLICLFEGCILLCLRSMISKIIADAFI